MADSDVKTKVVLKAGIWYTVCSFLTKGIAFITTPIFTRLLSSSEYGDYNTFVAWAGIIVIVSSLFIDLNISAELCIFGTFASFIVICIAVLILRKNRHRNAEK